MMAQSAPRAHWCPGGPLAAGVQQAGPRRTLRSALLHYCYGPCCQKSQRGGSIRVAFQGKAGAPYLDLSRD